VAHDSNGTSNVYSVATQYTDGSGALHYQSTFGGSYVDNDPLPPNGCDDGLDSVCLTDQQLQNEIQHVLTVKGWHGSTSNVFFLMTPDGVGSCFDSFSDVCTNDGQWLLRVPQRLHQLERRAGHLRERAVQRHDHGCDSGSSPNSDDADAELNTISHEHNEAITDPFGDGWWRDSDGQENGDLCAWNFGNPVTPGGDYNQLINGNPLLAPAGVEQPRQQLLPERDPGERPDARGAESRLSRRPRDAHEHDLRDLLASDAG
jgi:hypothetical protein